MPQPDPSVPLALLFGDSDTLKRRAAEALLAAWLPPEDRQMGLTRLYAWEVRPEAVKAELSSVSLWAARRVLLVTAVERWAAKEQEAVAGMLAARPEGVSVILLAGPGKKRGEPPLGAPLRRLLATTGQVLDCSAPSEKRMAPSLRQEARALGKDLTEEAAQRLAELVGGDYDLACLELEKLAAYVGESPAVSVAAVEEVASVSMVATSFQLGDALGLRDAREALRLLGIILAPGTRRGAGIPIVGMLARQIRLVWQARVLADSRGAGREALQDRFPAEQNYFPAVAGKEWLADKLTRQARKWQERELALALVRLYETDRRLKGRAGERMDDRTALELVIAELCR